MSKQPLIVACPTCKKKVEWTEASAFRPFCSDRCRLIDLGAWADESYKVPVTEEDPMSGLLSGRLSSED